VTGAVNGLMNAYCGDFELGGTVANVDLLGAHGRGAGRGLRLHALRLDDVPGGHAHHPLILNDVWTEAP
jgi:hypothetical protein